MDSLDLLAHPIRLRIVHAMGGGRLLTTAQLCARIRKPPRPPSTGTSICWWVAGSWRWLRSAGCAARWNGITGCDRTGL